MNGPWSISGTLPGTIRNLAHDSTTTAVRLWREARRKAIAMAAVQHRGIRTALVGFLGAGRAGNHLLDMDAR